MKCHKILLVLAILALGQTLYAAWSYKALLPFSWIVNNAFSYGIVMDAGSHGTRLHLFRYPARIVDPNKPMEEIFTNPEHIFQALNAPGIGTYAYDQPDKIGVELIKPLLDDGVKELRKLKVPESTWNTIPIGLKATAGMRDVNPDVRGDVFEEIRKQLAASPFKFRPFDARTISGEEEGMFGWLATNTASNTLFESPENTVGALDMGGASAQIVFRPTHTSIVEDSYEVSMGNDDIRIYSHSYLGYGWGDALGRVEARLAIEAVMGYLEDHTFPEDVTKSVTRKVIGVEMQKMHSEPLHITPRLEKKKKTKAMLNKTSNALVIEAENPCFPSGFDYLYDLPKMSYPDGRMYLDVDKDVMYRYMLTLGLGPSPNTKVMAQGYGTEPIDPATEGVFDKSHPHKVLQNAKMTLGEGEENPFTPFDGFYGNEKTHWTIHWLGTGNFDECRARTKALFYDQPCFTHSCAFNGVYQPRIEGSSFKGFGQYAKIVDALGVPSNPSLKTIEQKVADVCQTTYSDLVQGGKKGKYGLFDDQKVHKLCWKALWSYSFLVDGLKFDDDSQAITFSDPNADEGGWATGSMIYEANRLPAQAAMGRFKVPFFCAAATIVICFITILQLLCDHSDERKRALGYGAKLIDNMDNYSKA